MQPEILILDEPDAGLDGAGVAQLFATLEQLSARGTTVVVATHDVDLAYAWADEAAILAEGRLLRQGETTTLFSDTGLLAVAGLTMPAVLAIAQALRPPHRWPDGRPPRTARALIDSLMDKTP
jgi:cobalt/nickel transport system ATP-binding protein